MIIVSIYRILIPVSLRNLIYNLFLGSFLKEVRNYKYQKLSRKLTIEIPQFYANNNAENLAEYKIAAEWIGANGYSVFPYDYVFEYRSKNVDVLSCKESGLNYILHDNKRLYFPKKMSKKDCRGYYLGLLVEQDLRSPHRYNYSPFNENRKITLLDIGAAEGIFALSVIEHINKVYLFECDSRWIEALEWTFRPYSEQVEIVNKYVSDKNGDLEITLDYFIENKPNSDYYLKMDIEGAEMLALQGADKILTNKKNNVYISACTYHLDNAAEEISNWLKRKEYCCEFTSGVMAFGLTPPYFRKGMIYGRRNVDGEI